MSGAFLVKNSLRVDPTSTDHRQRHHDNVKANVLSPGITIDTVPSPVQNLSASPGNTNAVVSWKAPASNGGVALDATNPYQIKVMSGATVVRTIQVPTSAAQPCLGNTAGVCFNVGIGLAGTQNAPLANGTYTFDVQALNAVGFSDDVVTPPTTLSVNASATIIPVNTAKTLTTCTVATAAQSPCVQYVVPTGAGGVAGVQGNAPQSTVGCAFVTGGCVGNVALDLISATYSVQDVNHPITEIVTWDGSQAAAGLNSVIWYQSSNPSVHGGLPFILPACAKGGVAKPDPCLKSMNVLGSKNNPDKNAQGDLQVQINLTSDVDGGTMKH